MYPHPSYHQDCFKGFAFAFCLLVLLIKLKCTLHPSYNLDCFKRSYVILRDCEGEPQSPELLGRPKGKGQLDLKGGISDHLFVPCYIFQRNIHIHIYVVIHVVHMYVVYGNNVLIVAIYGLYCSFKMQFLRASLKKNPNFFPMGSFYVVLQIKYSLNCHNSKKSPMP